LVTHCRPIAESVSSLPTFCAHWRNTFAQTDSVTELSQKHFHPVIFAPQSSLRKREWDKRHAVQPRIARGVVDDLRDSIVFDSSDILESAK
jgi:hypothetical protein